MKYVVYNYIYFLKLSVNANTSSVTKHILEKVVAASLPTDFRHIVWTYNFRRLAVLVGWYH